MGMTMTQKDPGGPGRNRRQVSAGQLIEARLDLVLGNDVTTPVAITEFENAGTEPGSLTRIRSPLFWTTIRPARTSRRPKLCAAGPQLCPGSIEITHFYDVGDYGE